MQTLSFIEEKTFSCQTWPVASGDTGATGVGRVFSRCSASSSKHVLQRPFALRGTEPQRTHEPSEGKSSSFDKLQFHFSIMLPSADPSLKPSIGQSVGSAWMMASASPSEGHKALRNIMVLLQNGHGSSSLAMTVAS